MVDISSRWVNPPPPPPPPDTGKIIPVLLRSAQRSKADFSEVDKTPENVPHDNLSLPTNKSYQAGRKYKDRFRH